MPRPNPPPTPGSSSDIRGRESTNAAPAFHLPPAAYHEHPDRASTASAASSTNGSDSSYQPISPTSPAGVTRKRPASQSGPVITKEDFSLPPPPTRSRKIIQMKPKENEQQQQEQSQQGPAQPAVAASTQPAPKSTTTGQSGGKRKQGNTGTTAAGRKIARKTAHSLIERRRRSKMNEEFGVLKDMIPACQGQEMHKLAILQASIEYLRYLEQCVSDLQAQNHNAPSIPPPPASSAGKSDRIDEEDDEDEEMEDDHPEPAQRQSQPSRPAVRSGSLVSLPPLSQITSASTTTVASPSVFSTNSRHYSISSAASQSGHSPLYSNQTSPAFGPQLHSFSAAPGFGLGSPALKPQDASAWHHIRHAVENAGQHHLASSSSSSSSATAHHVATPNHGRTEHELDQEATAALLMLNNADRRNWRQEAESTRASTGMSVKDLLSG